MSGRREALRTWLRDANQGAEIGDATPLLSERLLVSVQVPELLLYIERLRSTPVELDELRPGVFHDLDTLCATFFGEEVAP